MIKHKISSMCLSIFCLLIFNACGASAASDNSVEPENDDSVDINEAINSKDEFNSTEDSSYRQDNGKDIKSLDDFSYQSGDLYISELNLEIKKLKADLDHYKANLRELSAKSQIWGNPFAVYNKDKGYKA